MQEQVTDKNIVITTKATKMTAEVLRKLLVLATKKMREAPQGKQGVLADSKINDLQRQFESLKRIFSSTKQALLDDVITEGKQPTIQTNIKDKIKGREPYSNH